MDSYKKKIVALEFAQEDFKKRESSFLLRIKELEGEMLRQQEDYDANYKKIVEINSQSIQTEPVKIKQEKSDKEKDKKKKKDDSEKEE